jgi:tRNA modification GTPase
LPFIFLVVLPFMHQSSQTIVALSTPPGEGAIGVVRLSGIDAIEIVTGLFRGKDLRLALPNTVHFGKIVDGETVVDEVVVSLFHAPRSYTGEHVVELSCHGSRFVLQRVLQLCVAAGARLATAGEFTQRAYLNGKLDLTQVEAVADLIASDSEASHRAAMHQLRGGFSSDLKAMRERLIAFSALIELELDFSEEDVAFADRRAFYELVAEITQHTQRLVDSFKLGNVVKHGVRVAITGKPNAGKSTLLNALLNEERAIVSDIAGTTRDTIEETLNIDGVVFRLIDTAGIRSQTKDKIEQMGIERSKQAIEQADVVIHLFDATTHTSPEGIATLLATIADFESNGVSYILVGNKIDLAPTPDVATAYQAAGIPVLLLSAENKLRITDLKAQLFDLATEGRLQQQGTIVTNARHHAALIQVLAALQDIRAGLDSNLHTDLIALDIRRSLHYLGEITGEITNEDKLDYIFSKFCIGK